MDFRTRINLQRTGLPKRFWSRPIHPVQEVVDWAKDIDKIMLDMTSPVYGQGMVVAGPGASENAAWAFLEVSNQLENVVTNCLFLDWSAFMDEVRDRESRSMAMDEALSATLLVLDQVEMATRPEWGTQVLTRVIKGRYDDGKPTILSTSKSIDVARSSLSNCFEFDPNAVRFVAILGEEG